jgi:hypothetical protein
VPNRQQVPIPFLLLFSLAPTIAQAPAVPPSFEVLTHRMDVDVDGAPNAYGPPGKKALDTLEDAHYLNVSDRATHLLAG